MNNYTILEEYDHVTRGGILFANDIYSRIFHVEYNGSKWLIKIAKPCKNYIPYIENAINYIPIEIKTEQIIEDIIPKSECMNNYFKDSITIAKWSVNKNTNISYKQDIKDKLIAIIKKDKHNIIIEINNINNIVILNISNNDNIVLEHTGLLEDCLNIIDEFTNN